jgi:hypothetical protein
MESPMARHLLSTLDEEKMEALLFSQREKRRENECYVLVSDYVCSDAGHGSGGEAFAVCRAEKTAARKLLQEVRSFWEGYYESKESNRSDNHEEPHFDGKQFNYKNRLYDAWTWKVNILPFEE